MEPITFKQAVLQQYNLNEQDFEKFVLDRTLFFRVRVVRPIVRFFNPDYLFNEHRLIENAGRSIRLHEIQQEIDFYQHKYVVNYLMKDALKFRLSGMKLIRLAHRVFSEAANGTTEAVQESPNP